MRVIPAIDIRGGRAVRLVEGDFNRETVYGHDPVAIAHQHRQAGAERLHVVDLDAALGKGRNNRPTVARIVEEAGLEVQVAGGVRDRAAIEEWLALGAAAVVMGTAAVRRPELFAGLAREFPSRLAAALDLRGRQPQVAGWTAAEPARLPDLLAAWDPLPLAGVILTAVERDGTFAGPDLEALAETLSLSAHPVTYSGGIASLHDILAVAQAGAAAVIVGKAIYEGKVDLAAALRAG